MADRGQDGGWVADPSITWRILLTARLTAAPHEDDVRAALAVLHHEQGWPDSGTVVVGVEAAVLRATIGEAPGTGLVVGLAGDTVVVSAHHSRVDGLGLLAVLAALTHRPVTSSARGAADRPATSGLAATIGRRLVEVATTPPARITGASKTTSKTASKTASTGDVYVCVDVPGAPRTADLVHAAARAVVAHNAGRTTHVAIAVGVSRVGGGETRIADHSALLRLRDVEQLDLAGVQAALSSAAMQPDAAGAGAEGAGGGALMRWGLRVMAPRLGSTLLVSHLGRLSAPGVEHLAFHPVTAGGTGISLGAATLGEATTLTLRARGRAWTHNDLERLLEVVARKLVQER